MKKITAFLLVLFLISTLSSCEKAPTLPLPQEGMELTFESGIGSWQSIITLHRDGSFSGEYYDIDMGFDGEKNPNGTKYTCDYTGKFTDIVAIDEHTYKMTLSDIQTAQPPDKKWYEDGFLYVSASAYGLEEGTEFVFHLPSTPLDGLSEEFLSWWPYRWSKEENRPKETLSCYGLHNVTTGYGFFNVRQ